MSVFKSKTKKPPLMSDDNIPFKTTFCQWCCPFHIEGTKLQGEYELIDCSQNTNVLDLKIVCGSHSGFKAALAYKQEGTISQ